MKTEAEVQQALLEAVATATTRFTGGTNSSHDVSTTVGAYLSFREATMPKKPIVRINLDSGAALSEGSD